MCSYQLADKLRLCPFCDEIGARRRIEKVFVDDGFGRSVPVLMRYSSCPHCLSEFAYPEQVAENAIAVKRLRYKNRT